MISGFFLLIFFVLIDFFIGLLPVFDIPSEVLQAFALGWGYMQSFSWLFPITTLVSVLSVAVFFHVSLLGYDLSLKVYHLIRGR
jgi:hypothetical protein